jgi:hypothetical protein
MRILPQSRALFGGGDPENGTPLLKLYQTDRSVHSSRPNYHASAPSVQADSFPYIFTSFCILHPYPQTKFGGTSRESAQQAVHAFRLQRVYIVHPVQ